MPRLLLGIHLLLLVLALDVQAQGEVVFSIENKSVSRAEFEYYYARTQHISATDYLPVLVDLKLQVLEAERLGIDTLFSFQNQLVYYYSKLSLANKDNQAALKKAAYDLYVRKQQRWKIKEWVRVAHITRYLPQRVDKRYERQVQNQMDSVYRALQQGADFEQLALQYSEDEASKAHGGALPWLPVHYQMQEWTEHLETLKQGEVSRPFYSPLGIHLVKWIEKKPEISFTEKEEALLEYLERDKVAACTAVGHKSGEMKWECQEIRDGLLVASLNKQHVPQTTLVREEELEAYYKAHRKQYQWDIPRFKGAVLHCKDKRTAKAIKRYLKRKEVEQWETAINHLNQGKEAKVKIEAGVFAVAENPYIDKLVFKCGSFTPPKNLPYTIVLGKKLKKGPESYRDVYDAVLKDYRHVYKKTFIEALREKYRVEIHQDVLKTVNYNGSK